MSQVRFFVFFAVLCSCSLLGHADDEALKTKLIDVSPAAPVVVSSDPTVVSDAVKPDTTTAPTTTSTTEATTTSTTTKTTEAPTTTSTTTTTTEAPTTTTTPAPTPTPKPGPFPAPDQGTWTFTDENNVTCIVVQFSAQLNVSYNQNVDNRTRTASVLVNVPVNVSSTAGNCNGSAQYIQLIWPSGVVNSSVMNSLRLNFLRNDTTKVYALRSLNVTVDAKIMVNSSTPGDLVQLSYGEAWQTPVGTSYRCSAPTQLNLTSESETGVVAASVVLAGLQEEAYRTTHGKGFSAARDCGGSDLPDAVPIAVGCALGGLVLVVLVAYLVARRRSAARGYLSM